MAVAEWGSERNSLQNLRGFPVQNLIGLINTNIGTAAAASSKLGRITIHAYRRFQYYTNTCRGGVASELS
jgi:hypothetical protein